MAAKKTTQDITVSSKIPALKSQMLAPIGLLLGLAILIYLGSKYLIIAWVDQKPITRFEYLQAIEQKYGNDTREQMITEKLILNEATKKGLSVSSQEIDTEIKKFETQNGGADQFNQLLQLRGINRNDLNKLVKLQLLRQQLFGANIKVSDDEVNKYVEQNKDQFPDLTTADASTSAKIKTSVQEQLKQQKINQAFSDWLKNAVQSPRVVRINP